MAAYTEAWESLNDTQKARVMLKQQHECCSRRGVFQDWPDLFDPNREQGDNELEACHTLIADRPDLFPVSINERVADHEG